MSPRIYPYIEKFPDHSYLKLKSEYVNQTQADDFTTKNALQIMSLGASTSETKKKLQ